MSTRPELDDDLFPESRLVWRYVCYEVHCAYFSKPLSRRAATLARSVHRHRHRVGLASIYHRVGLAGIYHRAEP